MGSLGCAHSLGMLFSAPAPSPGTAPAVPWGPALVTERGNWLCRCLGAASQVPTLQSPQQPPRNSLQELQTSPVPRSSALDPALQLQPPQGWKGGRTCRQCSLSIFPPPLALCTHVLPALLLPFGDVFMANRGVALSLYLTRKHRTRALPSPSASARTNPWLLGKAALGAGTPLKHPEPKARGTGTP